MKRDGAAKTRHYARPIEVMTVREVSDYLHVHPGTIYKLLKRHQIPASGVGSDWRFNIETIVTPGAWRRGSSAVTSVGSVNAGFRAGRTLVWRAAETA